MCLYPNNFKSFAPLILSNAPCEIPRINIKNKHENINDYNLDDIEFIKKYKYYEKIDMKMVA